MKLIYSQGPNPYGLLGYVPSTMYYVTVNHVNVNKK